MERNDIIKALEVCVKGNACTLCPLADDMSCALIINENALALIKSQEQRIEEITADLEAVRSRADETIDALRSEVRELTSENEAWQQRLISEEEKSGKAYYDLACEVEDLRAENERLMKALNTDISVVRVVSRGSGKTAHLHEVMRIKADAIRAAAVRELSDRFISELHKDGRMNYYIRKVLDQIAKEMLEGKTSHFYLREAEKNLRLLNEACGVVWHSIADELPFENGTYLVVGKSGTVCTAHFYPEHKIPSTEYAIIPGHFSNRYVRFWAKLPEPPIPYQDYQHTDNK